MKYAMRNKSGVLQTDKTGNSDYSPQSVNERIKFSIKHPSPQNQKGAKIAGIKVKGGRKSLVKLLGYLVAQKRLKAGRGRQYNGSAGA